MSKLVCKILCLLLIITVLGCIYLYLALPINNHNQYKDGVYDKKIHLLESIKSPKIILLGGSNVLFGLDGDFIGRETGFNTINMGMHAGLGLKFMIERIKPFVNKGDILVISPEYSHFFHEGSYYGESELLKTLYCNTNDLIYLTDNKHRIKLIKYLPDIFIDNKLLKNDVEKFNRDINSSGDLLWNNTMVINKTIILKSEIDNNYFNMEAINDIAKLNEYIINVGATMYYAFPYVPISIYDDNAESIQYLNRMLKSKGIITISTPENSKLSLHYFYDSIYHLNSVGRIVRTEFLVSELKNKIQLN